MYRMLVVTALALLCLFGCASGPQNSGAKAGIAVLRFEAKTDPQYGSGSFEAIDGQKIKGFPSVIHVPAGNHVVDYVCPGTISLDRSPSVRFRFEAGREYFLRCKANEEATLIQK